VTDFPTGAVYFFAPMPMILADRRPLGAIYFMADNRKWWKTWNSILHDAKFQNVRLEDIGFWTLLMSLICEQGERGKLTVIPPASVTVSLLRCHDIEDFRTRLKGLPNIIIEEGSKTDKSRWTNGQFTNAKRSKSLANNDNGSFTVTVSKWFTYQVDPTASDRVKRSRYKRREEKRREEATPFLSKTEAPKWS
jgi:hypothetical protein